MRFELAELSDLSFLGTVQQKPALSRSLFASDLVPRSDAGTQRPLYYPSHQPYVHVCGLTNTCRELCYLTLTTQTSLFQQCVSGTLLGTLFRMFLRLDHSYYVCMHAGPLLYQGWRTPRDCRASNIFPVHCSPWVRPIMMPALENGID